MEVSCTWTKAHCGIFRPFIPDLSISPVRAEVRKEPAIIQDRVPVIPNNRLLSIHLHDTEVPPTLKLSHFHLRPHMPPELQTAFHMS
jgi:hypothetical protein